MSQLKEYRLKYSTSSPDKNQLTVKGNYVKILFTTPAPLSGDIDYETVNDLIVYVRFDDEGRIPLRMGQAIKNRNYEKLTFEIIANDPLVTLDSLSLVVLAGEGEFVENREVAVIPNLLATYNISVPAGDTIDLDDELGPNGLNFSEYRLCIPSTEANGLFYSGSATQVVANAVWLEKGVIEWLTYTGNLYFRNAGASAVTLTLGRMVKRQ